MPYLQYVFCDDCGEGSHLDIDFESTLRSYAKESRDDTFINPATLVWDYLIYFCPRCGKRYKYKFRDIESKVRDYFSNLSKEYKNRLEKIDTAGFPQVRDEGSVVSKQTAKRLERIYSSKD